MSEEAIKTVIGRSLPKGAERLVLIVLGFHASEGTWIARVSIGQLVSQTNLAPSTVRSAIDALARCGDIEQIEQGGANGWDDSQGFRLMLPREEERH